VELSSVYHDVIKDRLYTDAANSPRRRSTQTALHRLVSGLCQMLAPILAFTADEAWEFIPGKPTGSVHESNWKPQDFSARVNPEIWNSLLALREHVLPELEKARQSKQIGKSLEAMLVIKGKGENARFWQEERKALSELLNVSQFSPEAESVDISDVPLDEIDLRLHAPKKHYFKELIIEVSKADGQKCERCWHWEKDIGQNSEHPTICGRCVEAVKQFKA